MAQYPLSTLLRLIVKHTTVGLLKCITGYYSNAVKIKLFTTDQLCRKNINCVIINYHTMLKLSRHSKLQRYFN